MSRLSSLSILALDLHDNGTSPLIGAAWADSGTPNGLRASEKHLIQHRDKNQHGQNQLPMATSE